MIYGNGYPAERIILENRLSAFKHYVSAWKKQDPDTVCVDGDIYSYVTKRGVTKRFRFVRNGYPATIKVEGFGFEPIEKI